MKKLFQKLVIKPVVIVMIMLCFMHMSSTAQDPVYSQPYLSPINLNPAATGAGDYDLRVSAI